MLCKTHQLIKHLDLLKWKEVGDPSLADRDRAVESIEPLHAIKCLISLKFPKEGSILFFEESDLTVFQATERRSLGELLAKIIGATTPLVFISCSEKIFEKGDFDFLIQICKKASVCTMQTDLSFFQIGFELHKIYEVFQRQSLEVHATMVDVYGLGVLLMGVSGVGKSETALGLIERRHRLVGDDLVEIMRRGNELIASGAQMTRHHIEIRGIGILNVAHMFGIVSVEESKRVDMVVELETWSCEQEYDRLGIQWQYIELLGINIPRHKLPVKPGRDLVLLIESIALNHRLRQMGINSAKDLQTTLQKEIESKSIRKKGDSKKRAGETYD